MTTRQLLAEILKKSELGEHPELFRMSPGKSIGMESAYSYLRPIITALVEIVDQYSHATTNLKHGYEADACAAIDAATMQLFEASTQTDAKLKEILR